MTRTRYCVWVASATLFGASLVPAFADDVHLVNGQVFEGVLAEEAADRVVIQLEFGQMTLPRSQVERVVSAATPFQRYLIRSGELRESIETTARDWLELAHFARSNELSEGFREAALAAARLDPEVEGIAPVMQRLGYVLDTESRTWMGEPELMRKRGLVRYDGEWMAEVEARRRQQELEISAARAAQTSAPQAPASKDASADRGPSDNEVMMAQVDVMKDMVDVMANQQRQPAGVAPGTVGIPMVLGYGFGGYGATPATPQAAAAWQAMTVRQPGSILPVSSFVRSNP